MMDWPAYKVLAPQLGEPIDVHRSEFARDVIDGDSHHEDADERVEQYTQFDKQRCPDNSYHAENEDAVFKDQIADHLHQSVAAADHQEQTDENQEDRRIEQDERRMNESGLHLRGQPYRQRQDKDAAQDRHDEANERLDLAVIVGARAQLQQDPREGDSLQGDIAAGQQ